MDIDTTPNKKLDVREELDKMTKWTKAYVVYSYRLPSKIVKQLRDKEAK